MICRSGIILCILLCLPILAIHTVVSIKKQVIRREFKHEIIKSLSKSDLVLITMSRADAEKQLEWEHEKEFEFHGQMYDVVESQVDSDSVKYWCWPDNDESRLNKTLEELIAEDADNENKRGAKQLTNFLKSFHFVAQLELKISIEIVSQSYFTEAFLPISQNYQPPSLPPECA